MINAQVADAARTVPLAVLYTHLKSALGSPYSVTESTTRRLEPLIAAEERGGELL
jgi:hypothetical protein